MAVLPVMIREQARLIPSADQVFPDELPLMAQPFLDRCPGRHVPESIIDLGL
jgi:hypothetical protein